jgi:hypothetical protein
MASVTKGSILFRTLDFSELAMAKKRVFLDECCGEDDLRDCFPSKAHIYRANDFGVRGKVFPLLLCLPLSIPTTYIGRWRSKEAAPTLPGMAIREVTVKRHLPILRVRVQAQRVRRTGKVLLLTKKERLRGPWADLP